MGNLQRFIQIGDSSGVGMIQTRYVTRPGRVAALCHLIGNAVPTLGDSMGGPRDLTLNELANLS